MPHLKPVHEGGESDNDDAEIGQPIAKFRGSFVIDHLTEVPKVRALGQHKTKTRDFIAALREGWIDVGIWKSAVRNSYLLPIGDTKHPSSLSL